VIRPPPREIVDQVLPQLQDYFQRVFRIPVDPSTAVTSWYRDPAVNRAVGGVPNSFHLWGLALDIVAPDPAHFVGHAREVGLEAIDFGTHIHLEPIGSPPVLIA